MATGLDYQPPAGQPPRKPVAWFVATLVGCALVWIRPESDDLLELVFVVAGTGMAVIGGVQCLRYLGKMQDHHYRAAKERPPRP